MVYGRHCAIPHYWRKNNYMYEVSEAGWWFAAAAVVRRRHSEYARIRVRQAMRWSDYLIHLMGNYSQRLRECCGVLVRRCESAPGRGQSLTGFGNRMPVATMARRRRQKPLGACRRRANGHGSCRRQSAFRYLLHGLADASGAVCRTGWSGRRARLALILRCELQPVIRKWQPAR